jgi:hypothetical protein
MSLNVEFELHLRRQRRLNRGTGRQKRVRCGEVARPASKPQRLPAIPNLIDVDA